jgi:hypothetical protein
MFQNRLRHLLQPELTNRFAAPSQDSFVPVAVPVGNLDWVRKVYRLAAEQTKAQLAPPWHLGPTLFSSN